MPDLVRVLMVEDVADDAALIGRELRRAGITGATRRVDSERGYREALQSFVPDIILTDHSLPTFGAADALRIALLETPETPVIVVTGSLDEETAAEYIKAGAADYVVKHHLERVGPAVLRALDLRRARAEQARAEEARRQGEERFRALIEHGADVVALVAPDGTLLFASHSIERLLGFAPAELVGRPAFERVHPDDLPRINAALRDIVASPGTPAGLELRWRHKDGSWRHIDAVAVDRLAEHAVGAIVVNFRDVSERRTAEAALRESEERYRTLVEGVRDIIFALSPEGTIASLNPAFETITGWRREEWVGRSVSWESGAMSRSAFSSSSSCGKPKRWRRSAAWRAASRTTSTTSSPPSRATRTSSSRTSPPLIPGARMPMRSTRPPIAPPG